MERIVVGVDESTAAADAARWAVRERRLRGGTLTAVLAWAYLGQHHGTGDDAFQPEYSEKDAAAALEEILSRAVPDDAGLIDRKVVCDLPARALLEASADADLLVVGARGLGGFRGLLLGSVSQQCAHHATVPIAVVRRPQVPEGLQEQIVVGVDGSATSQRALDWALDEARARQASVTVLHARPSILPFVSRVGGDPLLEDPQHLVAQQLSRADLDGVEAPQVVIVDDTPAHAIVRAAAAASLTVIGSRGRGGFAGLLLGSVSQQVTHHAPCPVVIIPPPPSPER